MVVGATVTVVVGATVTVVVGATVARVNLLQTNDLPARLHTSGFKLVPESAPTFEHFPPALAAYAGADDVTTRASKTKAIDAAFLFIPTQSI